MSGPGSAGSGLEGIGGGGFWVWIGRRQFRSWHASFQSTRQAFAGILPRRYQALVPTGVLSLAINDKFR